MEQAAPPCKKTEEYWIPLAAAQLKSTATVGLRRRKERERVEGRKEEKMLPALVVSLEMKRRNCSATSLLLLLLLLLGGSELGE